MANITQYGKKAADRLATATQRGLLAAADFVKLTALATINAVVSPLTLAAGNLGLQAATAIQNGYLAAADFVKLATLTQGQFNTLLLHISPPRARVYRTVNTAITTGTLTAMTFDATRYNSQGASAGGVPWGAGSPTRLTAPETGRYEIGATMQWAGNSTGVRRLAQITVNATTVIARAENPPAAAAGVTPGLVPVTQYQLTAGDYVTLELFHDAGVNLNALASANFSVEFWFEWRAVS